MFLRTTRGKRPDGTVDEYIRLVESDWNHGRPRHRVICNLGRKELLAPHAEALLRLLQGKEKSKSVSAEATAVGAWDWGVMLVARHFWQQLGLEAILDSLAKKYLDKDTYPFRQPGEVRVMYEIEPTAASGMG